MKHLYFIPKGHPRIIYTALKWSPLRRYGTTTALVCVLIVLWWFLHLRPLNRRFVLKQQALDLVYKEQQEINKLQEEIRDLENKLKELEQELTNKSPASFVAEWGACAQKARLFLISARTHEPSTSQGHHAKGISFDVASEVSSGESTQQESIYKKYVLVEFSVQGNFDALRNLMQQLNSLLYYACLESFTLDRYHEDSLLCTFIYKFYL